jgi:large subunit ribosomal protein L4e
VVSSLKSPLKKATENIPGLKVVEVDSLSVLDLVPGGHPIRLTIWTESAVSKLDEKFKGVVA